MDALVQIYQCFCDETRLRILNALESGSLCVCHLQDLLEEPQVKISKHLGYLRDRGLVEVERHQNWMIYSLPSKRSAELEANLRCLQDCVQTHAIFKADRQRLRRMRKELGWLDTLCCGGAKTRKQK
jgi:ArsR family transcriptional regulator, arsenate/arsenite/antimonite-responsive transcriptional repressor